MTLGWPEPGKAFVPKQTKKLVFGEYVKLTGDNLNWNTIQETHDMVYERAVRFLRSEGYEASVCDIKMIVKIETEKHAWLGDLVNGEAPFMKIGWRCEVRG